MANVRVNPNTLLAILANFYEQAVTLAEENERLVTSNAQPVNAKQDESGTVA